jgi:hypothetical protein
MWGRGFAVEDRGVAAAGAGEIDDFDPAVGAAIGAGRVERRGREPQGAAEAPARDPSAPRVAR